MSKQVQTTNNTQLAEVRVLSPVVDMVVNSVSSSETKRKYRAALNHFMAWYQVSGYAQLSKAAVQEYKEHLLAEGVGEASVNLRLSAIRKLAGEAADNGLLDMVLAHGIQNIKGVRREGESLGNWLTLEQAQALLMLPDTNTVKGLRDRAILAVFLACGLRRSELAGLTFEHFQKRESRWVIVDLVGKRNKRRSVPVPTWVYLAVFQYSAAAGLDMNGGGFVFRFIHKSKAQRQNAQLGERGMSAQALYYVVLNYTKQLAERYQIEVLKPHDLRRSFAKLARQSGGELTQIQKTLGHSSVQVTERYIGEEQDFKQAPGDLIDLHLL